MIYLIVVSSIWAFSFGLIKGNLTGLDSNFVASARMLVSLLVFLPFLRIKKVPAKQALFLALIGACQYGLMYAAYIYSYQFLKAYEVALFTIFTPIYVTLINDFVSKRFNGLNFVTASVAVVGTGVVVYQDVSREGLLFGFLILQIANLCFAAGQIAYREVMQRVEGAKDREVFGFLYLGALLVTGILAGISTGGEMPALNATHIWTLVYLGALASGLCFFLWNLGARRVEGGTLAILNNIKVPLAVGISIVFFGESANLTNLMIGGGIVLGALVVHERRRSWSG